MSVRWIITSLLVIAAAGSILFAVIPASETVLPHVAREAKAGTSTDLQAPFESADQASVAHALSLLFTDKKVAEKAFDTRIDLFAIYKAALTTTDSSKAEQALRVVIECHGMLGSFGEYFGVIAAGAVPEGPAGLLSQARRNAINELVRRCDGFGRMSPNERRQAKEVLSARARDLGSAAVKFQQEGAEKMTGDDVVAMLTEPSGSNFEALLLPVSHIVEQWAVEQHGADHERASTIGGLSAMLALCDLTETCRKDSLRMVVGCAIGSRCEADLTDGWDEGLAPEDRQITEDYRARVVASVRTRQWGVLGLP